MTNTWQGSHQRVTSVESAGTTESVSLPPSESIGGHTSPVDFEIWEGLESLIAKYGHPPRHILELFPAYIRRIHLVRMLAHYDLFKMVVDLPGCIVEMGVYRAPSLLTWAKLMETFCPCDRSRKIYGFDSFKGLRDLDEKNDGIAMPRAGKTEGGWSAGAVREEVEELVRLTNLDNLISGARRVQLIAGDIEETLPRFLEETPGLSISLLHLDVDLYKPTKFALEQLYDRVVTGGVIVFDEYGLVPWEGEMRAADEFFASRGLKPRIRKFPWSHLPHGYCIKGE
jgi:hypothetical protein